MSNQVQLPYNPFCCEMGEWSSAIFQTYHASLQIRVIGHLAGRIHFPARAIFRQLSGEFRGPLDDMVESTECGGAKSNRLSGSASRLFGSSLISRIRPSSQGHCATMYLGSSGTQFSSCVTEYWFAGMGTRGIF